MDTSSFYPNKERRASHHLTPTHSSLLTESECWEHAKILMGRCCQHSSRRRRRRPEEESSSSAAFTMGTLYCGDLGPEVYLRYRMAKVERNNNDDRNRRILLLNEALQILEDHCTSSSNGSNRVSLLESPWAGAQALEAAILRCLEAQKVNAQNHSCVGVVVHNLLDRLSQAVAVNLPPSECEVLYGRAGALQVILFLRHELNDTTIGSDLVVRLATEILQAGRRDDNGSFSEVKHSSNVLSWQWHGKVYLGAAHGVVGILHTLLGLDAAELSLAMKAVFGGPGLQPIQHTIDDLFKSKVFPSGNLYSSSSSSEGSRPRDRLVQWCHGAPGHVMLLCRAAHVLHIDTYRDRAEQIANDVIWSRGLSRKGVGLCHGISGNAYVFLSLGQVDRATSFAMFALDHLDELESAPDRPYSIYEGLAGLALLLIDLADPAHYKGFPLYL
jgi:Lanthionine synthetase C-like protein